MKRFCVVTILFILIVSAFIVPSFADNIIIPEFPVGNENSIGADGLELWSNRYFFSSISNTYCFAYPFNNTTYSFVSVSENSNYYLIYRFNGSDYYNSVNVNNSNYDSVNGLYYYNILTLNVDPLVPVFQSLNDGLSLLKDQILNPPSSYSKNPNVDEFIANTLISMGVKFNSFTSALPVAQSAWDYLIDEDNWYIGSGDRNDKDIVWDIDSAVSYLNAQSNNYMDWYNGYKVSKDVTVALNKFIIDNYENNGTLNNGTLAGENVYLNTQYMYASSGGSAPGSSFGYSPSAFSFYPASTVTYFNGQYLHDNNEIDLDEFIYAPADVRKFISYPSSAGLIDPPEDSFGTGVVTDSNGDTVYNIDLDFPSLDWLADAIQAVLDFLNRLITTIADFLTQILDAILSLFSDAFESLTTFGQGIIEWLYSVIESLGTLGSNYIPSDLWAIILPFIYLNVGIAVLMFVLRSH